MVNDVVSDEKVGEEEKEAISYLWIDFTNKSAFAVAIINFDGSINEARALLQVIQILNPNSVRIPQMHHLSL